jgi:hypothetical protein
MTQQDDGAIPIGYPKHLAAVGTGVTLVAITAMAYLSLSATEDFAVHFWGLAALLVGASTLLFLVPILLTHHELTDDALRLRVGLLLSTSVPLASIGSAQAERVVRGALNVGIGVRFHPKTKTLYVTPSFRDTVDIRLREETLLGSFVKHPTIRVVVSVSDRDAFLEQLSKRAQLEG